MEQEVNDIKALVYTSLISADNNKYSEDVKQESIYRYELERDNDNIDWEFVLEPFGADNKLLELFV